MQIKNLTPHDLVLLAEDPSGELEGTTGTGPSAEFRRYRKVAVIPPAGPVARAAQREELHGYVHVEAGIEVPVIKVTYGKPYLVVGRASDGSDLTEPFPEPEEGTMYYVSVLTAQAAAAYGRRTDDLLFAGRSVRDRAGRVIGILNFATL